MPKRKTTQESPLRVKKMKKIRSKNIASKSRSPTTRKLKEKKSKTQSPQRSRIVTKKKTSSKRSNTVARKKRSSPCKRTKVPNAIKSKKSPEKPTDYIPKKTNLTSESKTQTSQTEQSINEPSTSGQNSPSTSIRHNCVRRYEEEEYEDEMSIFVKNKLLEVLATARQFQRHSRDSSLTSIHFMKAVIFSDVPPKITMQFLNRTIEILSLVT